MLRLKKASVNCYRGIKEIEINLPKQGVLISDYGAGKTSILEAISLALGVERWGAPTEDSFFEGIIDFESHSKAVEFQVRITLAGSLSREKILAFLGEEYHPALGYWNEKEQAISFSESSEEYAIELVYIVRKNEQEEISEERYLSHGDLKLAERALQWSRPLHQEIGFFYFPMIGSNSRRWKNMFQADAKRYLDGWATDSKDVLGVYDSVHKELQTMMDQVAEVSKKEMTAEEKREWVFKVANFVRERAEKVKATKVSVEDAPIDTQVILDSFRPIIENGSYKDLMTLLKFTSYTPSGCCLLEEQIPAFLERQKQNLPCVLFFDEPESLFSEMFFWNRLIKLLADSENIQSIFSSHNHKFLDLFPSENCIHLHNIFGEISVLDEVVFDGLYH